MVVSLASLVTVTRLVLLSQKATVTGISESFMEANRTEATGAGMGRHGAKDIESRFTGYVEELVSVIGHADRAGPFRDYCTGLVMPGERKSVEPMAAITAPGRTAAQHQSLLHFVGQGAWSDEDVLTKVRQMVLPQMTRDGPIEAWIIDDTGLPKKGQHSVGVSHQYCGQLGKQANCQVAVTLTLYYCVTSSYGHVARLRRDSKDIVASV